MSFPGLRFHLLLCRHQLLRAKIIEQVLEFVGASLRLDLIFLKENVTQLIETFWLLELSPDRRSDTVESEALARVHIQCDEFVAKLRFHEVDCALVDCHSMPSPRRW